MQIKSYANLVLYVLTHLKPFLEGGPGFVVYDGHLERGRRMWLSITWLLEDTRGLPHPTGSKTAPAFVGGCPFCEVRGYRSGKTSVYVSAITYTKEAAIKAMFAEEHKGTPELLALASSAKPARMTSVKAIASATRVRHGALEVNEPYKSVSPYYQCLGAEFDFLGYMLTFVSHNHTFLYHNPHVFDRKLYVFVT